MNLNFSTNKLVQFSGGGAAVEGGRNAGGEVSVSRNEQQWQMNQAQMFATAAASSGFPSAQFRPQNWIQKNGIYPLMRPS